jgi:hypothetical protein
MVLKACSVRQINHCFARIRARSCLKISRGLPSVIGAGGWLRYGQGSMVWTNDGHFRPRRIARTGSCPGGGRPRPAGRILVTDRRRYLRRAGSRSAWWRASASADTRAYLTSDRTDVWPDRAMSIGVDTPSSAACVSALCRSWCSVVPPDAVLEGVLGLPVAEPSPAAASSARGGA